MSMGITVIMTTFCYFDDNFAQAVLKAGFCCRRKIVERLISPVNTKQSFRSRYRRSLFY